MTEDDMIATIDATDTKKKTGLKGVALATKDMHYVDPFTLVTETDWNARDYNDPDNIEHIDRLARSIAKEGVLEPLTVRFEAGKVVLCNGHMRHRAVIRARDHYGVTVERVAVVSEKEGTDDLDRLLNQGIRNTGKPNSPIEWASIIKRSLKLGATEEEIAARTGYSLAWVQDKINLAAAPVAIKNLVSEGTISASEATAQIREHGAIAATEKITEAVKVEEAKTAEAKRLGKVTGPVRLTKSKLDAPLGGKGPTMNISREEGRGAIQALRAIVAMRKGSLDESQQIAINFLESIGQLV